jgi:hypothetical protein
MMGKRLAKLHVTPHSGHSTSLAFISSRPVASESRHSFAGRLGGLISRQYRRGLGAKLPLGSRQGDLCDGMHDGVGGGPSSLQGSSTNHSKAPPRTALCASPGHALLIMALSDGFPFWQRIPASAADAALPDADANPGLTGAAPLSTK